jgi:ferredoxin
MKRKIVRIDEEKCDGCGLCVDACHEGALRLVNGKARLISESYCDGLGNCLPGCPAGAITIEEREATAYDEEDVQKNKKSPANLACGCPGTSARVIERTGCTCGSVPQAPATESQLRQWPCQLKLVPANASYLDNASLLIAADCTAYAYANIHNHFMHNKITLIGCPKLDKIDYTEKLTEILKGHEIKNITVIRMEVPCCGGLVDAVKQAIINSGNMIPWHVILIGTDGSIIEE